MSRAMQHLIAKTTWRYFCLTFSTIQIIVRNTKVSDQFPWQQLKINYEDEAAEKGNCEKNVFNCVADFSSEYSVGF